MKTQIIIGLMLACSLVWAEEIPHNTMSVQVETERDLVATVISVLKDYASHHDGILPPDQKTLTELFDGQNPYMLQPSPRKEQGGNEIYLERRMRVSVIYCPNNPISFSCAPIDVIGYTSRESVEGTRYLITRDLKIASMLEEDFQHELTQIPKPIDSITIKIE